jgi:hypothetical protein
VARSRVRIWTAVLAVLSPFVWCALIGASLIAIAISGGGRSARHERGSQRGRESLWARFRRRQHDYADERPRTPVDDFMDRVVGDIFNYVDGLGRAFPDETPQTERLLRSVAEIRRLFEHCAQRAVDLDCSEIQIVGHSLGSVIAFSSMTPNEGNTIDNVCTARLTRIYTIGSPLAKVRFFWPRLFEQSARGPMITVGERRIASGDDSGQVEAMEWHNFYNKLDLVSGKLPPVFPGWPEP